MDDEKEVETYNEYLSVFTIMGVIVFCAAFIATWMGEIPVTKDTPVKLCGSASSLSLILSTIISGYFQNPQHRWMIRSFVEKVLRREPNIELSAKKLWLMVSFILYLIGIITLTIMTGGGKQSFFTPVVLLTASLSPYIARKLLTKFVVGILTIFGFILTTVLYLGPNQTTNAIDLIVEIPNRHTVFCWATTAIASAISTYVSYNQTEDDKVTTESKT